MARFFAGGLDDAPQTSSSISFHVSKDNTRLGRASSKPARKADACGANSEARNLAKRVRYSSRFWLVTGRSRPGKQRPEHFSTKQQGAQGEGGRVKLPANPELVRIFSTSCTKASFRKFCFKPNGDSSSSVNCALTPRE